MIDGMEKWVEAWEFGNGISKGSNKVSLTLHI